MPEKKKGAKDRLRYEGASVGHEEIPEGHDLTHEPPHPKCAVCEMTRTMMKSPAKAVKEEDQQRAKASVPFDYGHIDLMKVRQRWYGPGRT